MPATSARNDFMYGHSERSEKPAFSKSQQLTTLGPRRPEWLRARAPGGANYHELKVLTNRLRLHTVCESARCPNLGECWEQRTATFMILGDVCTRRCGFCAVPK